MAQRYMRARAFALGVSALLLFQALFQVPIAAGADPVGSPPAAPSPSGDVAPSGSPTATPSGVPALVPVPSLAAAPAPSTTPTTPPTDSTPALAAAATEIVADRTEYSQTFDNHDGTETTQFFMDSAFYKPVGSSTYIPVQVGFAPSATNGVDAVSDQAPVAVAIADSGVAGDFLSLSSGKQTIGFRLPPDLTKAAPTVKPTTSGPVADYANLLPGVDLRVIAKAHGAKSFFIWHANPADPTLRYVVDSPGLSLVPQADGSIALVDATGVTIAAIPHPYAVDSTPNAFAGGGRYTDAVTLSLGKDGQTVTVRVDPAWLKAAVYPVYVDPSTGWVYNAGSNGYGDAHIASAFPTVNFDDYVRPDSPYYHELWNGTDPGGISGTSYDFLRWDLSALTNMTVDSASLALEPYYQYYNSPTTETTYARRVTSAWTENGITWATKPSYTTTDTANGPCVEGTWCTWNVVSIVQDWLTGSGAVVNDGFQLDTIGRGSTYWKRFIASEQGGTTRPKLTVTYHRPTTTAVSPTGGSTANQTVTWAYADSSNIPQNEFRVDVATNNLFTANLVSSGNVVSAAKSWAIPGALIDGTTYFWRVIAWNGSSWSAYSPTATFVFDGSLPITTFTTPLAGTTTQQSATTYSVAWTENGTGSAIASRSLQRMSGAVVTAGTCAGVTWANDGTAVPTVSPVSATGLLGGTCYQWQQTLTDAATNSSTTTSGSVLVAAAAPGVSAFTPPATPTNATSLPYSLTFSEGVTGLAAGDFAISGSATGWTVSTITGAGPYTITLTGGTAGTVILTLNANTVNGTGGTPGPTSASVAATVTVDRTAPGVSAFTAPATPTNATSLPYSLTFSESVTGLAAGDFAISGTATGWSIGAPTGSGAGPYTITLSGGGAGTVILTLNANTVTDTTSNTGPASASVAATVTVDRTAPAVSAFTPPATPTNATTLPYSLTFSESVTGLAAGDFVITGTATGWSVGAPTGSGAGPYTVTLGGGTAGTVILTLNANTVANSLLNPGPASASAAPTVTVDRTAPGVTAFTAPASPTNATSLPYSLTFSESVTGLAAGDFAITGSATGWTVGTVTGSGVGPYTVTLGGGTAGTVILTLNANSVGDTSSNTGPASASAAATVTVDRTAPGVSAFTPPASPTNATSLPYSLTFTESVSGLAAGDFAITGSATGWTVTAVTGSGVGPYTVTLTGGTAGTVILTLNANTVTNSLLNPGPTSTSAAPTVTVVPASTIQLGLASVSPKLDPELALDLTTTPAVLHPGSQMTASSELSYPRAILGATSTITATNSTSVASTIESATITLESRAAGQGAWVAFSSYHVARLSWGQIVPPPLGLPTIVVSAPGTPTAGVTYPLGLDAFVGSAFGPGSTATWDAHIAVSLDSALVHQLQDPAQTSGIRVVLHFEVSYTSGVFAQPVDAAYESTSPIQSLATDVSGASITTTIAGVVSQTFDASTVPALSHLSLGGTPIMVQTIGTLAGPTTKVAAESDAQYVARLRSYGSFNASVHVAATNATAGPAAADDAETLAIQMPILVVTVPPTLVETTGGSPTSVSLSVLNVGNINSTGTSASASLSGAVNGTSSGLGSILMSTTTADLTVTYQVPSSYPEGTTSSNVSIAWHDADGNNYGPISSSSDVWVTSGQAGFPTVSLAASDQTMFGIEPLLADASDNIAVTAVDLLVDGVATDTISNGTWEFQWDTTAVVTGDHVIQVRAHDSEGHASTTAPRSVHVDNNLPSDARAAADMSSGRLSIDDAATIRVDAIIKPASLPARYQSSTVSANDATNELLGAVSGWNDLQAGTQQTIINTLTAADDEWSTRGTPSQILATVSPDYVTYCSLLGPCKFATAHFEIQYDIDPGNPHNAPLDDAWQLSSAFNLETGCGQCDGVPDWIDRLAYGFEQAWRTYNDLGYQMPQGLTTVIVSDFAFQVGPLTFLDLKGRGLTLPWETVVPYGSSNVNNPIYVARHEFFHTMQIELLVPQNLDEFSQEEALFGTLALDPAFDPRWLLEATAEWGAHKAESKDLSDWEDDTWPTAATTNGDHHRYAMSLSQMLKEPERPLALSNEVREYGAFVFPEFLEEWATDPAAFNGAGALDPTPGVIKAIWTNVGNQQTSFVAIRSALEAMNPASNLADALSAFTRANYLLDASGVPGTYRDDQAAVWRAQLSATYADSHTYGDPLPPDTLILSGSPRPFRHQLALDDFYSEQLAHLDPGGSTYLEYKLPGSGGKFLFLFRAPVGTEVRASIAAFSAYPTPCAASTTVDVAGDQVSTLYFPDECQYVTVMLTQVDPIGGSSAAVAVGIQSQLVSDTFDRTVTGNWGVADQGWKWVPSHPATPSGNVTNGAAHLTVGALTGNRFDVYSPVTDFLAVAHFSDCSGSTNDLALIDVGSPIILTKGGLLVGSATSYVQLAGFDACRPWYIRILEVNGTLTAKVWQATEPEPAASQVATGATGGAPHVQVDLVGSPSSPARELIIDWISFDLQPVG